ncbi:mutS protein homolog 5-like isoform X3 [Rhodnius prolixus]|uniref:mutS protein homolog 5-like isoform X3 n=1 Tax=Rhodnius prolixus TaxID=13249 RepID=UPI003D18E2F0
MAKRLPTISQYPQPTLQIDSKPKKPCILGVVWPPIFGSASCERHEHLPQPLTASSPTREESPIFVEDNHIDNNNSSLRTNEEQPDESSEPQALHQHIIISIFLKKKNMAAASFNYATSKIEILERLDIDCEEYTIVDALIMEKRPMLIITSSWASNKFFEHVENFTKSHFGRNSNILRKLPPSYFGYDSCRDRVLEMNIVIRNENRETEARLAYILSVINLADEHLVCSLGALLYYINMVSRRQSVHSFSSSGTRIYGIKPMEIKNVVLIDNMTFQCLQIFAPEHHPSGFKWAGIRTKEGLSLYSLFGQYCAPITFPRLRAFMSKPVNDIAIIKKRHEVVNFCVKDGNNGFLRQLKSFLAHLCSAEALSKYLAGPTAKTKPWITIYETIYFGLIFAEQCRRYPTIEMFKEIGDMLTPEMYYMANHIINILDLEKMEKFNVFIAREGFHSPLDRAKERYSKVQGVLNKVTPYEFDSVPEFINKIHLIYVPEMGFLLVIPFWAENLTNADLLLPSLQLKFCSNRVAYYKSWRCSMLDDLYGDPLTDIINEESKIIHSLWNYIRMHIHCVISLINAIIDLDCVFALGMLAREQNYVKPELVDENVLEISEGRHPILSCYLQSYIPNDTSLASMPGQNLNIIHGPVASGKSLYLKQVALIAYMVHIGSFVPASRVKIGLLSHIEVRIQTYESIISRSSSLLSEFRAMGAVTLKTYCRSLIILDEIGRCASEVDSIAMLASMINYIMNKDSNSAMVLVSTRLDIVEDCLPQGGRIPYYVMDYKFEQGKMIFKYKLKKEKNRSNFTLHALETVCNDSEIVQAARQIP